MLSKSLAIIAALALINLAPQAQAANWTVSASGTITGGTDSVGLFGPAGNDLTGLKFTQTIVVTMEPAADNDKWTLPYSVLNYGFGQSYKSYVTVGAKSWAWEGDRWYGNQGLSNAVSAGAPPVLDDAVIAQLEAYVNQGSDRMFSLINVHNEVNAFVPSLDFSQQLSVATGSDFDAWTNFQLGNTEFYGKIEYLTVNMPVTVPVPEPETYVMLLAGLGLVGALARRRKPS